MRHETATQQPAPPDAAPGWHRYDRFSMTDRHAQHTTAERLEHLERGGIGGRVGTAGLPEYAGNLGYGLY